MKLTKENVEDFRGIHNEIRKRAFKMVKDLRNLDLGAYERFDYIDSLGFDYSGENVVIVGGDDYDEERKYSKIPIQYFYEEDWYEQAKEMIRLKKIEKEKDRERMIRDITKVREIRERQEYERLKRKFEKDNV